MILDWAKGGNNNGNQLSHFDNFFNWTMSYRLDSDIPYNYGRFVPKIRVDMSTITFDRLENKSKFAIWMSSHCETASQREIYIKELMKYVQVDIIGSCSNDANSSLTSRICVMTSHLEGSSEECLQHLSATYKFYLSFENSLCKDYVTEKFYRTAQFDLIPVVLNGANMSLFAPPHSYIDVQDFNSPKELATYLEIVGNHKELYNSYFWWKPFYNVEHQFTATPFSTYFCNLCRKINEYDANRDGQKVYQNIAKWWMTDGKCYNTTKLLKNI